TPVQRVRRQFTPKTWIKLGAVSAGVFVVAMLGITAVEFGTQQPISSLVSSTTGIKSEGAGHQTTLGNVLGGTERASQNTDGTDDAADTGKGGDTGGADGTAAPTEPAEEIPGQVGDGTATDGTSGDTGTPSGPATEGPGEGVPAEQAPAVTEPAVPEEPAEPGVVDQGVLPEDGGAAGTGQ
ncbi:hypothetical protein HER39_13655, partial [Arthrobacter deserti]|nr:hypothetical protein [Arthrobacter deserti]